MAVQDIRKQCLKLLGTHYGELQKQLAEYDKTQEDLLHFLENENFNGATMMKVAKQLKDMRIARRDIKIELEQTQSLRDSMKQKNINRFATKTYTYKTDALANIASRNKGSAVANIHKTK